MILENKDIYIDYGKTDFCIKKATITISNDDIKVFDKNGTYTFTNNEIKEIRITEAEDDEDIWL